MAYNFQRRRRWRRKRIPTRRIPYRRISRWPIKNRYYLRRPSNRLSGAIRNMVKNQEIKKHEDAMAGYFNLDWTKDSTYFFSPETVRGYSDGNRVANKIFIKGITIRGAAYYAGTYTNKITPCRLTILRVTDSIKTELDIAGAEGKIFYQTGINRYQSPFVKKDINYKVLYDKTFNICNDNTADAFPSHKQIDIKIKDPHPQKYTGNSDTWTTGTYMLITSSPEATGVEGPRFNLTFRTYYTDN